jgi:solute carrier family 44 protein 1 (choline transporter-like protein)
LQNDKNLHYYGIIVLVIFVFAWFVADAFTDIYKMVIDTILICFCEDGSRNNGKV